MNYDNPRVVREAEHIEQLSAAEARAHYKEKYGRDPAPGLTPKLVRSILAYRLQEEAYGGLDPKLRRKLEDYGRRLMKDPKAKWEVKQRLPVGTLLKREWGGETHEVAVEEEGYRYHGTIYSSLSQVAKEITGTRWSGPRFFGTAEGAS